MGEVMAARPALGAGQEWIDRDAEGWALTPVHRVSTGADHLVAQDQRGLGSLGGGRRLSPGRFRRSVPRRSAPNLGDVWVGSFLDPDLLSSVLHGCLHWPAVAVVAAGRGKVWAAGRSVPLPDDEI